MIEVSWFLLVEGADFLFGSREVWRSGLLWGSSTQIWKGRRNHASYH